MRDQLFKLSIGESRPKKFNLFSFLIRLAEGTNHSHVFISWKDELGLRWVAESRGAGIQMLPNKELKQKAKIIRVYNYKVSKQNLDEARKYVWETLPKNYGYRQMLGLFEMRVKNWIYRFLKSDKKASNRYIDGEFSQVCCEFAIRTIQKAKGIKVSQEIDTWGLIETSRFCILTSDDILTEEKIEAINGRV